MLLRRQLPHLEPLLTSSYQCRPRALYYWPSRARGGARGGGKDEVLGRNQIKVHPAEHQYQIVDCWLDRCDVLSGILGLGNDVISTSSFSLTSSDRLVNASWRAAPTKNHDYAPPPTHPLSKNPY